MKTKKALLAALALIAGLSSVLCAVGAAQGPPPGDDGLASVTETSSVTCLPLGLHGTITSNVLVDNLCDGGDEYILLGTTNGLYVLAADGTGSRLLYSPFAVSRVMLIDDVTGDGTKEIVFTVNSTVVPCLRCYDGASGELLWESAVRQRLFLSESGWTQAQLPASDVEFLRSGGSQRIVVASYRNAACFEAATGRLLWTFESAFSLDQIAVVGPSDGGESDRILLSSIDGCLYLLDASGRTSWQQRLPRSQLRSYSEVSEFQSSANELATVDKDQALVALTTTDGWLRLLDLNQRAYRWEIRFGEPPEYGSDVITVGKDRVCIAFTDFSDSPRLFPVADISGDGTGEILLRKPGSPSGYPPGFYPGGIPDPYTSAGAVMLVDSLGEEVWEREFKVPLTGGIEAGMWNGGQVALDINQEVLEFVDLATGQVVRSVQMGGSIPEGAEIKGLGNQHYAVFNRNVGDIQAISASGEAWWHYPRIGKIRVLNAKLNGDSIPDNLFLCELAQGQSPGGYEYSPYPTPTVEIGVRLIVACDGQTNATLWSYGSLGTNGMYGIQMIDDILGEDGIPDIVAYQDDDILTLSGADGALSGFAVDSPIDSVSPWLMNGVLAGFVTGLQTGPAVFDVEGTKLWDESFVDLCQGVSPRLVVVDDLNRDGISDLGIVSVDNMTILKSDAGQPRYTFHASFSPPQGTYFDFCGIVPDVDGDGVQDLGYVVRQKQHDYSKYPPPPDIPPVMTLRSVVDGRILLEVERGMSSAWMPACGDFNGDGCMDSIVTWCPLQEGTSQYEMEILSGKDGTSLGQQKLGNSCCYGQVPASSIGDVNGDGCEEVMYVEDFSGYTQRTANIIVYDVHNGSALKKTPCGPVLLAASFGWESLYAKWGKTVADMNSDGILELVLWLPEATVDSSSSYVTDCLALVDTMKGDVLSTLWPLTRADVSLFDTHQPYVIGVATRGSLLMIDMRGDFQVTSPNNGSATGSRVQLEWEPGSAGYLKGLFVDGKRAAATDADGAEILVEAGEHQLLVKLMDRNGRVSYASATIHASGSPVEGLFMAIIGLLMLATIVFLAYPRTNRLIRTRRRRSSTQTS